MSESDLEAGQTRVVKATANEPHAILLALIEAQVFRLALTTETATIGRALDNEARLDFSSVSRKHCVISRDASGKYSIEDLKSTAGTSVNGTRLTQKRPLFPHDVVTLGNYNFTFVCVEPTAAEDRPLLIPEKGGDPIFIASPVVTVGRGAADIVIGDRGVSSRHAIIETFAKDSVYVCDLQSANGTTINGERITEPTRLQLDDVVAFAGTAYRLSANANVEKTQVRQIAGSGNTRPLSRAEATGSFEEHTDVSRPPGPGVSKPHHPTDTERFHLPDLGDDTITILPKTLEDNRNRRLMTRAALAVGALGVLLFPYSPTIKGDCRLVSGNIEKVRALMGGQVQKVLVAEGDDVKKNQVLIELSAPELTFDKQKQEAALQATRARLAGLKPKALKKEGEALRADSSRSEKEIARLDALLENTKVRADIDGRVVSASPQSLTHVLVSPGQELLEIDNTDNMLLEILVPEHDISDVQIGQHLQARIYANAGTTYESKVAQITPIAEHGPLGSVVIVKAQIANSNGDLIPGTTGSAKIVEDRQLGIVLLAWEILRVFK